jgi:hypothetical protein
MLYLGIFIILSTAFDIRFYHSVKPPPTLFEEAAYSVRHFQSLLHHFSLNFIILLDGEAVAHSYVVDRMLAEFAAAAVVLAEDVPDAGGKDNGEDKTEDVVTFSMFAERIEGILQESYPRVFPYYSRCLDQHHKHFLWTGPQVQILHRSEGVVSILPLTTMGELLDLPGHRIYTLDLDDESPTGIAQLGKRRDRGEGMDSADEPPKKRKRALPSSRFLFI